MHRSPHEVCSVIVGLGLRHFIAWSQSEFEVFWTPYLCSLQRWLCPVSVAAPQRSPQGCSATREIPWRGACAIAPPAPCPQESPQTALGLKSGIWAVQWVSKPCWWIMQGSCAAGRHFFSISSIPKVSRYIPISITNISVCLGTRALHHL